MARRRKPNGRSSIYFSESDGKWHGWVVVGVKKDGTLDRRHRMAKTETEVTEKVASSNPTGTPESQASRGVLRPSPSG